MAQILSSAVYDDLTAKAIDDACDAIRRTTALMSPEQQVALLIDVGASIAGVGVFRARKMGAPAELLAGLEEAAIAIIQKTARA